MDATGLLLISTRATHEKSEQSDDNLLFSFTHPQTHLEINKLKNLAVAVSGAGRASCGQQVQSMLLSSINSSRPLRLAFVHTQEVLLVQVMPGQICSATATAAAVWLLQMLFFLLGPWHNWLQDKPDGTGVQLSSWCSQQLAQLLPVLLPSLHRLALQQPSLARLLLTVGVPAVKLPQQLQQQLAAKLHELQQLLPPWLPVAAPQQQQQECQPKQQQQQLMGPSCCLFCRGCLVYSNVQPWLVQRLWGMAWAIGLHSRTAYHPSELLLQDAFINLAAKPGLGSNNSEGGTATRICGSRTGRCCDSSCTAQWLSVEWKLPMTWQQQRQQQQSWKQQQQEQLHAYKSRASASAGLAEEAGSSTAVDMVQPCTVIAACLGPYTLMGVADRLPAAAEADSPSEAMGNGVQLAAAAAAAADTVGICSLGAQTAHATGAARIPDFPASTATMNGVGCNVAGGAGLLSAAVSCLAQVLVSHNDALQQQMELSSLPAIMTGACQCRSSTQMQQTQHASLGDHAQQQQQEQQQERRELVLPMLLPQLHLPKQDALGSSSGQPAESSGARPPGKALRLLKKLLLCIYTEGDPEEDCVDNPAYANGNIIEQVNTQKCILTTAVAAAAASVACPSAVLTNPGTAAAACGPKQHRSSRSSLRALQRLLLGRYSGEKVACRGCSVGLSSSSSRHRLGCLMHGASSVGGSSTLRHQACPAAAAVVGTAASKAAGRWTGSSLDAWMASHSGPGGGSKLHNNGMCDLNCKDRGASLCSRTDQSQQQLAFAARQHSCSMCGATADSIAAQLSVDWEQGTFAMIESTSVATATDSKQHCNSSAASAGINSSLSSSRCVLDAAAALFPYVHQLMSKAVLRTGLCDADSAMQQQQQVPCSAAHEHFTATVGSRGLFSWRPQQPVLLPAWDLSQLEHHGATAGEGSGSTVLDARPEPWMQHQTNADLLLAGMQRVQVCMHQWTGFGSSLS